MQLDQNATDHHDQFNKLKCQSNTLTLLKFDPVNWEDQNKAELINRCRWIPYIEDYTIHTNSRFELLNSP